LNLRSSDYQEKGVIQFTSNLGGDLLCIRHILPPYGERKGCTQLGKEGQERGLRRERRMELCRWEGGWKLEGEDVASETEEAKTA
jgi:hypothetical protein